MELPSYLRSIDQTLQATVVPSVVQTPSVVPTATVTAASDKASQPSFTFDTAPQMSFTQALEKTDTGKNKKLKFMLVSTHIQQFTGYAKVSHGILEQLAKKPWLSLTHFGFQKHPQTPTDFRKYPSGVDVIDAAGNMVSATPSAGWLQSSPAIPELGFCLGTRCQMFWLDETLPNGLQPGKRPRTTLSPALVLRDGKPWMSFGTPGGEQQDQWQSIMLLRMLHHGMNIQEAIDAPSFHSEHWISSFWPRGAKPGKLVIEGRYAPEVLAALKARGHQAEAGGDWSEGRLTGARLEADGTIRAGANPRGMQGYAVGR